MEMGRPIETVVIPALAETVRLSDLPVGLFVTIASRKGLKKAISKGFLFPHLPEQPRVSRSKIDFQSMPSYTSVLREQAP